MGRKKRQTKNKSVSVSLEQYQIDFIKTHPDLDFSKFVQLHFRDYINLALEVDKIECLQNQSKEEAKCL